MLDVEFLMLDEISVKDDKHFKQPKSEYRSLNFKLRGRT